MIGCLNADYLGLGKMKLRICVKKYEKYPLTLTPISAAQIFFCKSG